MTPDPFAMHDVAIDGNTIRYWGMDGNRREVDIKHVFDTIRAWERIEKAWRDHHYDEITQRHTALEARLDEANWFCQGAGGGKADYLPPDWETNEGGPMICVPYAVTVDWQEKMTDCERRLDAWLAEQGMEA
jgi:hypothetical protein